MTPSGGATLVPMLARTLFRPPEADDATLKFGAPAADSSGGSSAVGRFPLRGTP
jgi:hypothetical protein